MTAVLYHHGLSAIRSLEVVVERRFGLAEAEYVPDRHRTVRRELHVGSRSLPQRPLIREQLVDLIRLLLMNAERLNRHVEHGLLRLIRIEADGDEQLVRAVSRRLAVEDHAFVVG